MTEQSIVLSKESMAPSDLAHAFAASGYFDKVNKVSQALVKIIAGQELGLGPTASINGLHYIDGSLSPGANVMATLIKDSPLHNYKILELDNEKCTIRFFERFNEDDEFEEMFPDVTFTMDDAAKAKLMKPRSAWEKHEKNMLFARAMSNGFKWHTPQLSKGTPLYDKAEFDSVPEWEETEVVAADPIDVDALDSAVIEDPELAPDDAVEPSVAGADGERLPNQWELEIVEKAVDLGFANANPHAVNILNKSPFASVPYTELDMELAIAWFACWSAIGEQGEWENTDQKRAAALSSWATKEDREGYRALAIDALGG